MKRFCLLFLVVALLSGCAITPIGTPSPAPSDHVHSIDTDVIELGSTHFATHVSEVASDPQSYLGMTIRLQGYVERYPNDPHINFSVLRDYDDGESVTPWGFDCRWTGELPNDGEWIDVTGTLGAYTDAIGDQYLRIDVVNYTVIPEADRPSRLVYD